MSNFEVWLTEIIESDPHYMINIVCSYYDDCAACPLRYKCQDHDEALTYLTSIHPNFQSPKDRTK